MKVLTDVDIINCFQRAIGKNHDLIIKEYSITDTSYEAGYKFGLELYQRLSVDMIYNCDVFYNLFDTLRYAGLKDLDKDSIRTEINNINKNNEHAGNSDFFTARGVMYFQIMDIENALKDFNKAIALDKNAIQSIYFKAWTLEIKKEYEEAITLYNLLVILTNKPDFKIFAAIAKRKKAGL